jgi:hypothetical protein
MKTEIEIPDGCKIAKTEIIDGKLIVTYERDFPDSVKDIPDIVYFHALKSTSLERASAVRALTQLIELAAYVGCDDFYFNFCFDNEKLESDFEKKYADLFEKAYKIL